MYGRRHEVFFILFPVCPVRTSQISKIEPRWRVVRRRLSWQAGWEEPLCRDKKKDEYTRANIANQHRLVDEKKYKG